MTFNTQKIPVEFFRVQSKFRPVQPCFHSRALAVGMVALALLGTAFLVGLTIHMYTINQPEEFQIKDFRYSDFLKPYPFYTFQLYLITVKKNIDYHNLENYLSTSPDLYSSKPAAKQKYQTGLALAFALQIEDNQEILRKALTRLEKHPCQSKAIISQALCSYLSYNPPMNNTSYLTWVNRELFRAARSFNKINFEFLTQELSNTQNLASLYWTYWDEASCDLFLKSTDCWGAGLILQDSNEEGRSIILTQIARLQFLNQIHYLPQLRQEAPQFFQSQPNTYIFDCCSDNSQHCMYCTPTADPTIYIFT